MLNCFGAKAWVVSQCYLVSECLFAVQFSVYCKQVLGGCNNIRVFGAVEYLSILFV